MNRREFTRSDTTCGLYIYFPRRYSSYFPPIYIANLDREYDILPSNNPEKILHANKTWKIDENEEC